MRPTGLRKQFGGTTEEVRAQSNLEAVLGNVTKSIIMDGVLLTDIAIGTTPTLVSHKLSRPYRGYFICKNSTQCTFSDSPSTDDSKFIQLQSSVATTVSIWVF